MNSPPTTFATSRFFAGNRIPCRLDKYLRDAIGLSRKAVIRAINADRVRLNGDIRTAGTLVFDDDVVEVDDERVIPVAPDTYAMLHKPSGFVTTTHDPRGRPCIDTWLRDFNPRTFPVGRLDLETTGLLLLTDDGDLAHMLLHPKHHVRKAYIVTVTEELSPDDERLTALLNGVEIPGGRAAALELELLPPGDRFRLVIDEGRNRQVRRMVRQAKLHLTQLHRATFGPLQLGLVAEGEARRLSDEEVEILWGGAKGRTHVAEAKIRALARRADEMRAEARPDARLDAWLEENAG